ncbi:uncharacterized protein LOC132201821, partial [Neocloeon triangulifer]|uniref:uncharacterized protein LOC132201821 n=1 Tax=Neocloeon triangulifer TaxID=2078957 RepID=UPI00286F2AF9
TPISPPSNTSRKGSLKRKPNGVCKKRLISNYVSLQEVKLTKNKLLEAAIELCTVNGRPFTILKDSGMKKILNPILEAMPEKFNLTPESLPQLIREQASKVREETKSLFKKKMFSLKMDAVTRLDRGYLGVNIQRVVGKKIVIRTLGCIVLLEQHTAQYIYDELAKLLVLYDLTLDQIYSCTYDNGRNMVRAGKIIDQEAVDMIFEDMTQEKITNNDQFESNTESSVQGVMEMLGSLYVICDDVKLGVHEIRCMAHTLQLAIEGAMKEMMREQDDSDREVLSRVRELIKKLRTPRGQKMISDYNLASDERLTAPVLDVPTRWCSTYDMLESCLKFKAFCSSNKCILWLDSDFLLSDDEFALIEKLVEVLKHPKVATLKLQAEQSTTNADDIMVVRANTLYKRQETE